MSKSVYRELLIAGACYLNYISAHAILFVWREMVYYLMALAVGSFAIGIFVASYTKSILYSTVLLGVGAITAVIIAIAPGMIYGAGMQLFDIAILWYGGILARIVFISLPLCVSLALIGAVIGDTIQMQY